jgi:hypothetical protein
VSRFYRGRGDVQKNIPVLSIIPNTAANPNTVAAYTKRLSADLIVVGHRRAVVVGSRACVAG